MKGYKLCPDCGCPMLKRGQHRKHPEDYRHAQGCPSGTEKCPRCGFMVRNRRDGTQMRHTLYAGTLPRVCGSEELE